MRSRRSDGLCIVFLGLAGITAAAGALPAPPVSLDQIVANNAAALGRSAPVQRVQIDLKMQDGGQNMDATYSVTRDGRMRIDILQGGKRVYTEAYDGRRGWDMGKDGSTPAVDPHADALWHGTQFPGDIFGLADLKAHGHKLEYQGRENLDGVEYYVLKLTLSDGFVTYRYVDPGSWLITRGRDFRAFHPALDGKQTWVETQWSDYRTVGGMQRSFLSVDTDLVAHKILASQQVVAYRIDPSIPDAYFEMPAALAR